MDIVNEALTLLINLNGRGRFSTNFTQIVSVTQKSRLGYQKIGLWLPKNRGWLSEKSSAGYQKIASGFQKNWWLASRVFLTEHSGRRAGLWRRSCRMMGHRRAIGLDPACGALCVHLQLDEMTGAGLDALDLLLSWATDSKKACVGRQHPRRPLCFPSRATGCPDTQDLPMVCATRGWFNPSYASVGAHHLQRHEVRWRFGCRVASCILFTDLAGRLASGKRLF